MFTVDAASVLGAHSNNVTVNALRVDCRSDSGEGKWSAITFQIAHSLAVAVWKWGMGRVRGSRSGGKRGAFVSHFTRCTVFVAGGKGGTDWKGKMSYQRLKCKCTLCTFPPLLLKKHSVKWSMSRWMDPTGRSVADFPQILPPPPSPPPEKDNVTKLWESFCRLQLGLPLNLTVPFSHNPPRLSPCLNRNHGVESRRGLIKHPQRRNGSSGWTSENERHDVFDYKLVRVWWKGHLFRW